MCIRRSDRMPSSGQPTSPYKRSQRSIRSLNTTDSTNPDWYYSYLYDDSVHAWILPPNIAQSRLGGRKTPSSACTIIAINIAKQIANCDQMFEQVAQEVNSTSALKLSDDILNVLTNSIIEGNEIHLVQMNRRRKIRLFPKDTFTIPEALLAVGHKMHEIDFESYRGDAWTLLPKSIESAIKHPAMLEVPTITFILIMYERALLLVYNKETNIIAIFDSHSHGMGLLGAIIAVSSLDHLADFSTYICSRLFPELMRKRPHEMKFEISCIQYLGRMKNGKMAVTIKEKIFPPPMRFTSGKDGRRFWNLRRT